MRILVLLSVVIDLILAELPSVSFSQLSNLVDQSKPDISAFDILRDAGDKFGFIVITEVPEFSRAAEKFRHFAPSCLGNKLEFPQRTLGDGSRRRTYATDEGQFPDCLQDELSVMSKAYDKIERLITVFLEILAGTELFFQENAKHEPPSIVPLVESPHKDHLHLYSKPNLRMVKDNSSSRDGFRGKRRAAALPQKNESNPDDYLVPFHIDNGLFLIITPFPGHGLILRDSQDQNISTEHVDSDSVIVLFGLATIQWLFQSKEFDSIRKSIFPVPHAVPSLAASDIDYRSVYARMKVAPPNSVPHLSKSSKKSSKPLLTFEEVFKPSNKWSDSQVCSVDLMHKRDAWMETMESVCAEGEAYCWMGCYPLPQECPTVDRARCFSTVTNVTCSTKPGGKPMDPTCQWTCKPRKISPNYQTNDYCNGKMDMFMTGFETAGDRKNPCIILFFEAWTLDSRVKFIFACLGVMTLGICIEGLIYFRRMVSRKKRPFVSISINLRKALLLVSFGLNLCLGYLAMLVAMTYSVELFIFVIIGLMIGHALFNLNSPIGESVDPCCASQNEFCTRQRSSIVETVRLPQDDDGDSPRVNLLMADTRNSANSPILSNGSCCSGNSRNQMSNSPSINTQQTVVVDMKV